MHLHDARGSRTTRAAALFARRRVTDDRGQKQHVQHVTFLRTGAVGHYIGYAGRGDGHSGEVHAGSCYNKQGMCGVRECLEA